MFDEIIRWGSYIAIALFLLVVLITVIGLVWDFFRRR